MNEPTSDVLSRLKHAAQEVIRTDGGMTACKHFHSELDPNRVLALIECAEIVRTDYLLLSRSQQRKALRALKVLE